MKGLFKLLCMCFARQHGIVSQVVQPQLCFLSREPLDKHIFIILDDIGSIVSYGAFQVVREAEGFTPSVKVCALLRQKLKLSFTKISERPSLLILLG